MFNQGDRLSNRELYVSSLMDFSHLGSSSPSTLYGDLPRTSVLMKPNSPRICSSVYSEVSSPDLEFQYRMVILLYSIWVRNLFNVVHAFIIQFFLFNKEGGGGNSLCMSCTPHLVLIQKCMKVIFKYLVSQLRSKLYILVKDILFCKHFCFFIFSKFLDS